MTEKKAKTPSEALLMAAELVEHGWTREQYARDSHGRPLMPDSPKAVRFCMYGAVMRVSRGDTYRKACRLLQSVVPSPIDFNDKQTSKRPIIAALRKAAEL